MKRAAAEATRCWAPHLKSYLLPKPSVYAVALSVLQMVAVGAAGTDAAAFVGLVAVPQHNVFLPATNLVHLAVLVQVNPGVLALGALALIQAAASVALSLSTSPLIAVSMASLFEVSASS